MTHATKLYLIAVGAIIVLSAGTASAQLPMPGIDLMKEKRPLDPEEAARRKAVDDAYKSTMEKLPDQKKSKNDPWGNIRSTTKTSPQQR
jgi:hypothetical protein